MSKHGCSSLWDYFFLALVIYLHTLLVAPIQILPRDQPVSLLGGAGPKAGPLPFPLLAQWSDPDLHPCLGSLHLSSAIKEHKVLLLSSGKPWVCLNCTRVICYLLHPWLEWVVMLGGMTEWEFEMKKFGARNLEWKLFHSYGITSSQRERITVG